MKGLICTLFLCFLCSQAKTQDTVHKDNPLQILTSLSAKEFCTCYFVVGRGERFCRQFIVYKDKVISIKIYPDEKIIQAWALGVVLSATAKYFGEDQGCRLLH